MNSPRAAPSLPWRRTDMVTVAALTAVGFGGLVLAWWAVSGTARVSHQATWVTVGAAAVVAMGAGNGVWLLRGRRAIGERRQRVLGRFEREDTAAPDGRGRDATARPVSGPGMTHYHRPDCQLVRDKPTTGASPATHRRAGRQPCGMCEP